VDPGHAAPDPRLRADGLAGRPGGLDRGEVSGLERLRRRRRAALLKDVLLTNVMLYWVTGAINSSFWPYYARRHVGWPIPDGARIEVPTAYASFPREILHPPRAWAERVYNIRRWTVMPAGGHFAALEEPEALAADLRAFFRDLR